MTVYIVYVIPEMINEEIDSVWDSYIKAYDRKKELEKEWGDDVYGALVEIITKNVY